MLRAIAVYMDLNCVRNTNLPISLVFEPHFDNCLFCKNMYSNIRVNFHCRTENVHIRRRFGRGKTILYEIW